MNNNLQNEESSRNLIEEEQVQVEQSIEHLLPEPKSKSKMSKLNPLNRNSSSNIFVRGLDDSDGMNINFCPPDYMNHNS